MRWFSNLQAIHRRINFTFELLFTEKMLIFCIKSFIITLDNQVSKMFSTFLFGGLILIECQVPTKPLYHSPPQKDGGGEK